MVATTGPSLANWFPYTNEIHSCVGGGIEVFSSEINAVRNTSIGRFAALRLVNKTDRRYFRNYDHKPCP